MTDYITLQEATEVTGLKSDTLQRFIEAGYINIENDDSDTILLCYKDLESTFGIQIKDHTSKTASQTKSNTTSSQQTEDKKEKKKSNKTENPSSQRTEIIKFQEKIISQKDQEIATLKDDIQWLRKRIEQLEDQSQKDKVLLLSSNHTIDRLIEVQAAKRGIMHKTLKFLGFNQDSPTIDKSS